MTFYQKIYIAFIIGLTNFHVQAKANFECTSTFIHKNEFFTSHSQMDESPSQSANPMTSIETRANAIESYLERFSPKTKKQADFLIDVAMADTEKVLRSVGRYILEGNVKPFDGSGKYNNESGFLSETSNHLQKIQSLFLKEKEGSKIKRFFSHFKNTNSKNSLESVIENFLDTKWSGIDAVEAKLKESLHEIDQLEISVLKNLEVAESEKDYLRELILKTKNKRENIPDHVIEYIEFQLVETLQNFSYHIATLNQTLDSLVIRRSEIRLLEVELVKIRDTLIPTTAAHVPEFHAAYEAYVQKQKLLAEYQKNLPAMMQRKAEIIEKNRPRHEKIRQLRAERAKFELEKRMMAEEIENIWNTPSLHLHTEAYFFYMSRFEKVHIDKASAKRFSFLYYYARTASRYKSWPEEMALTNIPESKRLFSFELGQTVSTSQGPGKVLGFFKNGQILVRGPDGIKPYFKEQLEE